MFENGIAEISMRQIKIQKTLGSGTFGAVFLGLWNSRQAAIKQFHHNVEPKNQVKAAHAMWKCVHPNVVTMFGLARTHDSIYILMEYCAGGSLFNYLQSLRKPLSPASIVNSALQIINAMEYLLDLNLQPLLSSPNVLVTRVNGKQHLLRVTDYTSSFALDYHEAVEKGGFSCKWMAPETLRKEALDAQSEIWSFGVVFWELMTLTEPFEDSKNNIEKHLHTIAVNNRHPPIPQRLPPFLVKLFEDCWSQRRPTFADLRASLTSADANRYVSTKQQHIKLKGSNRSRSKSISRRLFHSETEETPNRIEFRPHNENANHSLEDGRNSDDEEHLLPDIANKSSDNKNSKTGRFSRFMSSFRWRTRARREQLAAKDSAGAGFTTRTAIMEKPESGDVGLQIEFDKHRSHLGAMVSSIKPGSPADKAGNIYIGDVIVGINGEFMLQSDAKTVLNAFNGPGSIVVLNLAPSSQVHLVMEFWVGKEDSDANSSTLTGNSTGTAPPSANTARQHMREETPSKEVGDIFPSPEKEDHDLYEFLALESTIRGEVEQEEEHDGEAAQVSVEPIARKSSVAELDAVDRRSKEPQEAYLSMETAVAKMRQRLFLLDDRITKELDTMTNRKLPNNTAYQTQAVARAFHEKPLVPAGESGPGYLAVTQLKSGHQIFTLEGLSSDEGSDTGSVKSRRVNSPGRRGHRTSGPGSPRRNKGKSKLQERTYECEQCHSMFDNEKDYRLHLSAHRSLHIDRHQHDNASSNHHQ
eukprot:m.13386 g.13386  ORF g.13386 m.13386 type:complete len:754 (+) comp4844_c0_seq2:235-2496(+)